MDTQWVDNGPRWVAARLADADAVLAIEPDFGRYTGDSPLDIDIVGTYPEGAECAVEVRTVFSDEHGAMREDPATGSLNASLPQWLLASGTLTAPYTASQDMVPRPQSPTAH